jgi:hypothetical protein
MRFLVAKRLKGIGCVAIDFNKLNVPQSVKAALNRVYANTDLQIIDLSHPHIYGEYAPYNFVESEGDFMRAVAELIKQPDVL